MHFLYLFALALLHKSIKEWTVRWSTTSAQCKIMHCFGSALVIQAQITHELQHVGVCVGVKETWLERRVWRECGVTTRGCGVRW